MISIIIPVLNEARALPATLDALFVQQGNYEVILVDAASDDAGLSVAALYPEIQILQAERGRARQMNAGARRAQGNWLIFLRTDTLLPANALATIAALDTQV